MKAERQEIELLKRILRLRGIEKLTVQRELAEARESEDKFRQLRERSAEMAERYSLRRGHDSAGALSQSLGLANALSQIGITAQQQERDAGGIAEKASQRRAQLDHQEDRLSEKIAAAESTIEAREHIEQALMPRLARPLLSKNHNEPTKR